MRKFYYSLGLMSGTSMDGVDTSIIQSDGESKYKGISNKYFEYSKDIYEDLTKLRDKIKSSKDLKKFSKELKPLEREITLFHAKVVNEIVKKSKVNIDFIGFHGQTIFHNAKEKISKQLGDGKLLSKLTKKTVVYDFRQNDLKNGGQGAPLAPIFHKLLANKHKFIKPVTILNIGGIANVTFINTDDKMYSADIGPGNCLIDQWIKLNSKKKYDYNGMIAKSGKINKKFLNKGFNDWEEPDSYLFRESQRSYDIKDFDSYFVHGLSLEDGAATLTEFTAKILSGYLIRYSQAGHPLLNILVCGGGRKNKFLLNNISKKTGLKVVSIDKYANKINGDFIESQAFAYLAIRSYLKKFITFPTTTGVKKPCLGGLVYKS